MTYFEDDRLSDELAARMRDESPFERERADYDGACEVCGRPSSSQWCARCSEDA